jgi:hypothetical protein
VARKWAQQQQQQQLRIREPNNTPTSLPSLPNSPITKFTKLPYIVTGSPALIYPFQKNKKNKNHFYPFSIYSITHPIILLLSVLVYYYYY